MDSNRLRELAGKQDCETRCSGSHGQLNLGAFDDDCEWSDDPPPNDSAASISVKATSTEL